ncbi:MAG: YoaK family protein [Velocimicrobium sp.]
MKKSEQMSESLKLGTILALSGGFMDAYTYLCRGHVFANAQTGNIILFAIHLSDGNFKIAIRYIVPIIAFTCGIVIADLVRFQYKQRENIHWRQITVLTEAIILFMVSFLPQEANLLANSMVSFACGIQVESFRKIKGNGIATTMCIGNLRTATQALCDYCYEKEKKNLKKSLLTYGVIVIFAIGAVLGNSCVGLYQERAILISSGLMLIGFFLMFQKER